MQLKLLAVASNLSLTLSPLFDNSEILYPSVFSTSSPFVIFDLKWYIYFVVRKFVWYNKKIHRSHSLLFHCVFNFTSYVLFREERKVYFAFFYERVLKKGNFEKCCLFHSDSFLLRKVGERNEFFYIERNRICCIFLFYIICIKYWKFLERYWIVVGRLKIPSLDFSIWRY